jgi:YHS domain-containing protein
MFKTIFFALSLMVLAAAGGCVENHPSTTTGNTATPSNHAECLVCKLNADMACIDVDVDKDTPSYTYNGKTYYFCSKACAKKFQASPEKYVEKK